MSVGRRPLRPTTVVHESILNAVAALAPSVLVACVAAIAAAGVVLGTASQVGALSAAYHDFAARGGNVAVILPPAGERLDAGRCEQLNRFAGVVAAGGTSTEHAGRLALAPSALLRVRTGTPTLARVLWPGIESGTLGGVVLGSALADRVGAVPGAELAIMDPTGTPTWMRVAVVAGPSPRDQDADRLVLIPAATLRTVDSCLVEIEPGAVPAVSNILVGWFGSTVKVTPYTQESAPGPEALRDRVTRGIPFFAAFAMILLFAIRQLARRGEFAVYALLGMSRGRRLLMISADYATVVLVPSCVGATLALALHPSVADQLVLDSIAGDLATLAAALSLGPLVVAAILGRPAIGVDLRGR